MEDTTETPEERAEAVRRADAFAAALRRGMEAEDAPEPTVVIFDPLTITDPKHPKAEATDRMLWERLLTEAAVADIENDEDPDTALYCALICIRTNGAELEPYAPKGWKSGEPLEWRIAPGPEYPGGKERYVEDRDELLVPYAARLTPLLRRMKLYARRDNQDA